VWSCEIGDVPKMTAVKPPGRAQCVGTRPHHDDDGSVVCDDAPARSVGCLATHHCLTSSTLMTDVDAGPMK